MNNEFVSVPRELVERLIAATIVARGQGSPTRRDAEELLAQPAAQHQGQPVALPDRDVDDIGRFTDGWNACLDEIAKLGQLFTHADAGKVERLREENKQLREIIEHSDANIGRQSLRIFNQRAQLAERDALLREVLEGNHLTPGWNQRMKVALSASAEPIHPDDIAVNVFARVMKSKMAASRNKGRGGWEDKEQCTADWINELLRGHIAKGDPVDVANFCMMLHQRGERITLGEAQSAPKCKYCGDTGKIMVGRSGDANDGNAPILEPCEDCDRGTPVERDERAEFERENRYIVIKIKDLKALPAYRKSGLIGPLTQVLSDIPDREFLVIESDWPEYESTWAAIEARTALERKQ
jgi:hypothetical protein